MHRSGTSALTRSLNLLGAELPKTLLRPGPDNLDGFWESELFVQHDDRILSQAGLRWQDPWNLPDGLFEGEAAERRAADLATLIDEEIGSAPLFVIKEPRICRLLPLWRRALDLAGRDVSVILALRDPIAVAQSVHRRDGLPMPTALLLWLRHVLEAEHGSRDVPRVTVTYEDLITDWRAVAVRVGASLGIDWPARTAETEAAIDALLGGRPQRGESAEPSPETGLIREWVEPVYRDLIAGAQDRATLDRVRAEIERSDALLGPAARLGANWSVPEIWQLQAGLDRARSEVGRLRRLLHVARGEAARTVDDRTTRDAALFRYGQAITRLFDASGRAVDAVQRYRDMGQRYLETKADAARRYEAIVNSTSWRLTRPLRRLTSLLKRQSVESQAEPESAERDAAALASEAAHLASETDWIRAEIARREAAALIARSCLFDPDYYRASYPELQADIDPLIHFIEAGAALGWNPNRWFDLAFYTAANPRLAASGANPLIDYIEIGAWEGPDPHPGFDQAAYLARNAHLGSRYITPLGHFLLYAAPPVDGTADEKIAHTIRVIAQSGLFDSQYYGQAVPDCGDDALRHYVETGSADPNPWFDTGFYVRANKRLANTGGNPLLDYIEHGAWEGPDPHPGFDNARYLREHPDLASRYMTPLAHFLIYGVPSWLAPAPALAPPLPLPIDQSLAPLDPAEGWAWDRMLRSGALVPAATSRPGEPGECFGTAGRAKILLVSHEFSRTGAPLILLRLVQALARRIDAELYVFTDKSGPLEAEFAAEAHVLNGDVFLPFAGGNGIFSLTRLLQKLAPPAPVLAICNTANTQAYGLEFRKAGIPVINLVHEAASGYAEATYRGLFTAADRVVFSSRYVLELARAKIGDLASEARLIGQGLLNPDLLEGDREEAAASIRAMLGLGQATRIVLTCGSLDLRKGADLFLGVALAVLRGGAADTHFVWVGGGDTGRPALGWWLEHDEAISGYADRIHFLGSLDDTAPWFLGSDLFLLTSREDPFPCVAHEAMASGLPLIGFEHASGALEALGGTGVFVPYLDVAAMADTVAELMASPSRRRDLADAARDRVIATYDFADYVTRIIDLAAELGVVLPPLI